MGMAHFRVMENESDTNPLNEEIDIAYARACELARATWDIVRDLPREDLTIIYQALTERFLRTKSERVVVALESMRRCAAANHGELPGAARYDDIRKLRPDLDLRSAKFVRNTFGGSWSNARAMFDGEPITNILRRRLTSSYSCFTDSDLLGFISEFIQIHRVEWVGARPSLVCTDELLNEQRKTSKLLSQSAFRTYARRQENHASRRFPSVDLIIGRFGSWVDAVAKAASKLDDSELRVLIIETTISRDDRREQLNALLQQCADEWRAVPTQREYDCWLGSRSDHDDVVDRVAARAFLALRTSKDAITSFKSWNQALVAAGLTEQSHKKPRQLFDTRNRRFSRAEILDWIRIAACEVKRPINDALWEDWRRKRLELDLNTPIPSARTVRDRFGSHAAAKHEAELVRGSAS